MKVAVIGAGVIGLSTALTIQENIPGVQVTVIAKDFSPDTTGDVAAGILTPHLQRLKGTSEALIKQMVQDSFNHFDHLLRSKQSLTAGVSKLSGYILYREPPPKKIYEDIIYCCKPCTDVEFQSIPLNFPYGLFLTTVQVECRRYLPWLLNKITSNGGLIQQKKVHQLDELFGQYHVIVNCAANGNRQLTNDDVIMPVRGQAVKVRAPGIKHFYSCPDEGVDVIPCFDTVHLGSTFQQQDGDPCPCVTDRDRILKECKKLVPGLEGAEFVRDAVGFRPWREPVRMEREVIPYGTRKQQVVHNYGHCSSGVALSWGAALHATSMVKQALKAEPLSAKL